MRKIWYLYIIFLLFSPSIKAEEQKDILILHSYHQGLRWTDEISAGISKEFLDFTTYELHFQYLNYKRANDQNYLEVKKQLLMQDIASQKYEAIICSDNVAYDVLCELSDSLDLTLPIVACGINSKDEIHPYKPNFYPIRELISYKSTLDLIEATSRGIDTLWVINDNTYTGQMIRADLEESIADYETDMMIVFYDHFSMGELESKVSRMGKNSAIYLLVLNRDRLGEFISYHHGLKSIVDNATVPVYGSWSFYLGNGIVGGAITGGRKQGKVSAQLVIRLLNGEKDIAPSDYQITNRRVVDYELMQKFNIKKRSLPDDVSIINAPDRKLFMRLFYLVVVLFVIVLFTYRRNQNYLKKAIFKRTRELKMSLRKKDEFFSLLAHDLRSPMGNLSEGLKFLEKNMDKWPEKRRQAFLQELTKTSSQLYHLLEDILVWGRFQFSSKYSLEVSRFSLKEAVDDVCAVFYLEKEQKYFKNKVDDSLMINSDAFIVKFILRNLISNALKFSDSEGEIEIGADRYEDYHRFWVKDQGQGMNQEIINSIVDNKPIQAQGTQGQQSFGLGLMSVKAYLKELGAYMTIDSQEGEGACFYIYMKDVE